MHEISINLVYEDTLSGAVLRKLLSNSGRNYLEGYSYLSAGYGWIKKKVGGLNSAARGMPYLILTDLDRYECPPALLEDWGIEKRHPNLLFSIAVREVEAWILACRGAFAKYLSVNEQLIPRNVDGISDPKSLLISIARRSRKKNVRTDIVPQQGSTAKVGPDYNGSLIYFVEKFWDPNVAKGLSPSLRRTVELLDAFQPVFENQL